MQPKILILVFLLLAVAFSVDVPSARITHDFCWKDSYPRGVGTVPDHCAEGQERIGLLCYTNCPSGMYRWGFDCHSYCPNEPGWDDQGLFCRLCEYGRGAGYPWHFGDGFNDSGMIRRCEADYGDGGCEKYGAMYYPKCSPGYHNYGCCICRPEVPNCADFNLNQGIDLSCAKKVIIGDVHTGQCYSNEEKDVGLCYPKCDTAFDGVGPVCWGRAPEGWVGCGMGAAIPLPRSGQILSSIKQPALAKWLLMLQQWEQLQLLVVTLMILKSSETILLTCVTSTLEPVKLLILLLLLWTMQLTIPSLQTQNQSKQWLLKSCFLKIWLALLPISLPWLTQLELQALLLPSLIRHALISSVPTLLASLSNTNSTMSKRLKEGSKMS